MNIQLLCCEHICSVYIVNVWEHFVNLIIDDYVILERGFTEFSKYWHIFHIVPILFFFSHYTRRFFFLTFTSHPDCPKTGQATIPHPEDCHKFFDCWDGFGYEFTCPNATTGEQLVYNPTIGKCDYEGCNKTSTAASVVNNTLEIINSTEGNDYTQ